MRPDALQCPWVALRDRAGRRVAAAALQGRHMSRFGQDEHIGGWSEKMQAILDEMRRRKLCDFSHTRTWTPTINLYESPSGFYLCVHLAGVEAAAITVECAGDCTLRVMGQRPRPMIVGVVEPLRVEAMEIDEGPFHREVELPGPVDAQSMQISHDKGYIWITLRKTRTT